MEYPYETVADNRHLKARWEHDGEATFFGHVTDGADKCDMLWCEGEESLIYRFSDVDSDYKCFPLNLARLVAANEKGGIGIWSSIVTAFAKWVAAGSPEADIATLGEGFYDHFTVAARFELTEEPEDEMWQSGCQRVIVGISPRVTEENIEQFINSEYPGRHCQHEYDCCGQTYGERGKWSYVEGMKNRVIQIDSRWYVNV